MLIRWLPVFCAMRNFNDCTNFAHFLVGNGNCGCYRSDDVVEVIQVGLAAGGPADVTAPRGSVAPTVAVQGRILSAKGVFHVGAVQKNQ